MHQGEVYVACQLDCGSVKFGLEPPPDSEDAEFLWRESFDQLELFGGEG